MVDDQEAVLSAFQRNLRSAFDVEVALSGADALSLIEKRSYAVVVSDLQMPGMNGIELLTRIKQDHPQITRVMLTGTADLDAAIDAVNQGSVFQFLTKPCSVERLTLALHSALRQHELVTAESELLERTLSGSVALLSELLGLMNPEAFRSAMQIRKCVRHMATAMRLPNIWEYDLAAMLSRVGFLMIPGPILEKLRAHQPLSREEAEVLRNHPAVGQGLLAEIPRLEMISRIVRYQSWPCRDLRDPAIPEPVALGAQMLQIATYLKDAVEVGRSQADAVRTMLEHPDTYHSGLVGTLTSFAQANCMTCARDQACV